MKSLLLLIAVFFTMCLLWVADRFGRFIKRINDSGIHPEWRKTYFTICIIIFFHIPTQAQTEGFVGVEYGNTGAGINAGAAINSVEIKGGVNIPLIKENNPSIIYVSLGKRFYLGEAEGDRWSFTPSIGYARLKQKDFSKYSQTGDILQINTWKPKYSLEVGKDQHIGRFYATLNYVNRFYYTIGIRARF